ncbi:PRA1 family protein F4-like [Arachis stenosperma]|uniref:PRA1 family protein F4-like n=1 Tax=Arachis stenosperma TaxID=217475 RepID=UPI0025AC1E8F|nr:PRA1 family protein F4-like [Arachis stenosperma]
MANFGTSQRIPTSSKPSTKVESHEPKENHEKLYTDIKIYCPFNMPLTSEAAAIRIMRNLGNLGLYYTLFFWIILFIVLIPRHKISLIILVIMTYVITIYCLILRAFPYSIFLHKVIDKRFVLSLLVFVTVVMLVVTEAGSHLAVTLAIAVPIILIHSLLWIAHHHSFDTEDHYCNCNCEVGADGTEEV